MRSVIACSDLTFGWPNGTVVLDGVTAAFTPGRTGLIGVNGSGKSTLLRLIAGQLQPHRGTVTASGDVGYLPQDLTLDARSSVADLLGIAAVRAAIRAIELGDVRPELFETVGTDWDADDRARAWLDRLGLTLIGPDTSASQLSGGELVLVALTALFLRRPDVILLDEPTNNLDLEARRRLYQAVADWPGTMVIVSHDRELLERVDQIAELSGGTLRSYGGTLSGFEAQLAAEQEAAERAVSAAAAEVTRQRRDLAASQVKQARRDRHGKRMARSGSIPKVAADERRRHAQESAGRSRELHEQRLAAARDRLADAERAVRDDPEIRVDLPGTIVPGGRTVLTVSGLSTAAWHPAATAGGAAASTAADPATIEQLVLRGPEHVALTGPNGAGKTTLLRAIAGHGALDGLRVRAAPVGYLPQRLDLLDDALTVAQNVHAVAPGRSANEVRQELAKFQFRGNRADQLAAGLSGGERFRAVLAALLLADPPPQLLLLDEPTNNLDGASVRQLLRALAGYRGALLVASHDVPFLRSAGITRWLRLDRTAGLQSIEPL